ncbi:sulfurtransferase TusA family protein [Desulfofustis glycolicus]|uniref:Sulfurtransferase TusA n=1 Tax=Desulfofustis glycolicus DSM 9705 TaxID=1121409 RepID=A0A1M5TS76_9BACT|nr:sulfurtransferase TusA family protein [Desulfofustis glycolicus]MCB2216570.1 sulfurtransferase TusA family protein [Desulfobulbaceae bacterium]SHH53627.1 Sulfurtransferase TusA [Desulfofustis glycolicus DSM 9705]
MTDKPHIIMDLRNFVSWVALLKITQVFDAMAVSDVLEIRGADPDTKQDLFKILPASAYEVLTVDDQEGAGGSFQVRIQKRT